MKAAVFHETGKPLAIEDIAAPQAGLGELVLKVEACGVCASDTHAAQTPGFMADGVIPGHEFVGEVADIGPGVTGWEQGQRATAMPFDSCGECLACRGGEPFRCSDLTYLGFSRESAGAFAEYVRVDARNSLPVPASLSISAAAMIEPLAVGYDAAKRAHIGSGDSVLIIGAGPIGLTIALWARHRGARHIVVSDIVESRLEVAMQVGASATIKAGEGVDTADAFAELTGQDAPDVIFEVVGARGMISRCIDLAGFGTRIAVVGVCMEKDSFMPALAIRKGVELLFCIGYSRQDWSEIIALLESGAIDPTPIVTGEVGFAAFPQRFEDLKTPGEDLKVLLVPEGEQTA